MDQDLVNKVREELFYKAALAAIRVFLVSFVVGLALILLVPAGISVEVVGKFVVACVLLGGLSVFVALPCVAKVSSFLLAAEEQRGGHTMSGQGYLFRILLRDLFALRS